MKAEGMENEKVSPAQAGGPKLCPGVLRRVTTHRAISKGRVSIAAVPFICNTSLQIISFSQRERLGLTISHGAL